MHGLQHEHGHLIRQWNHTLSPQNLQRYADSIAAKGAALQNCFGFVDGTVRPICHPKQIQREVFNGHKSAQFKVSICYCAKWHDC